MFMQNGVWICDGIGEGVHEMDCGKVFERNSSVSASAASAAIDTDPFVGT
jgi:hypothetical protein